jgi:hypothetical protein
MQTAQYCRSSKSENAEKEVNKSDIHNQETAEETETKCCECWENYMQKTKKDGSIKFVSCRNSLQDLFPLHKDKCVDCIRKLLREKKARCRRRSTQGRSLQRRHLTSAGSNIVY